MTHHLGQNSHHPSVCLGVRHLNNCPNLSHPKQLTLLETCSPANSQNGYAAKPATPPILAWRAPSFRSQITCCWVGMQRSLTLPATLPPLPLPDQDSVAPVVVALQHTPSQIYATAEPHQPIPSFHRAARRSPDRPCRWQTSPRLLD